MVLTAEGYLSPEGKATRRAAEAGLLASCEKKLIWNVGAVAEILETGGLKVRRQAVNQTLEAGPPGEPVWGNLGTLGTYFSVSAVVVGQWIDALGLREAKEPTQEALDGGLAVQREMDAGQGKTRKITHWELNLMKQRLMEAGHELDFDYAATLRGRGLNSDVEVTTIEGRARRLYEEWRELYLVPATRDSSWKVFDKQPKFIIEKVEALMERPGFIQRKEYLKLRR